MLGNHSSNYFLFELASKLVFWPLSLLLFLIVTHNVFLRLYLNSWMFNIYLFKLRGRASLAQGRTSREKAFAHHVQFLSKLRYCRLFHFERLEWKKTIVTQDVMYLGPNDVIYCHVLGTREAALICNQAWAPGAHGWEFGSTRTNVVFVYHSLPKFRWSSC